MTMTRSYAPRLTTHQFRMLMVLAYAAAGVVVLLIWAGVGFSS